ncbi:MAG: class II aldolase/adducin family protein [Pseudomonadota bacterium]
MESSEFAAFRNLSAQLGRDPLRVQGPGGNTSIKNGDVMWIKASGTELAEADTKDIFVAVDLHKARAEVEGEGDGSCRATVLDTTHGLRPSIETTFHAILDWPVVAHTHSIATLAHGVATEGISVLEKKLRGLPFVIIPYAKPGLPLTRKILAAAQPDTRIFVLCNHGLICGGETVAAVSDLIEEVEARLMMTARSAEFTKPEGAAPDGFAWSRESWMAQNEVACARALEGSYYPDHVVFLGPALSTSAYTGHVPALLIPGEGIAIRKEATASQRAMLKCLSDLMARVPEDWHMEAIGPEAEAELLDWDAEKYRQALAART